jgi:hypothetical protein
VPAPTGILSAMASGDARKASSGGKGSSTGRGSGGRVTHKQPKAQPSSRYTPPIPREKRVSPRWYPWVLLSLFIAGLAVIVVNYASIFWGATNWVLLIGLAAILTGTIMATRYH